jgi:hypothetical protein
MLLGILETLQSWFESNWKIYEENRKKQKKKRRKEKEKYEKASGGTFRPRR